jgi:hypothetical protein
MTDIIAQQRANKALVTALQSTPLKQAALRYQAKLNGAAGRAIVIGCSIEAAVGATGGNGYAQQLATNYSSNAQWSNYGWASRPMAMYLSAPLFGGTNIGATADAIQIRKSDLFIGFNPINDLCGQASNAVANGGYEGVSHIPQFQRRAQSVASFFAIPDAFHTRAVVGGVKNPAVTYTGTWTVGYNNGGSNSPNVVYSSTVGNTASYPTAYGDLIFVRFFSALGATGTFTVSIDGVSQGTFSSSAQYDTWSADLLIFRVARGTHTVLITHASGDNVMPHSVSCVDTSTDYSATLLYMAPPPQTAQGWSAGSNNRGFTNSGIAMKSSSIATGASVANNTLNIPSPDSGRVGIGQIVTATGGTGVLAAGTMIVGRQSINLSGNYGAGGWLIYPAATTDGTLTGLSATLPGAAAILENNSLVSFTRALDDAMAELRGFGMNIARVYAEAGYNPLQYQNSSANYLHPNDAGYAHLYRRWKADLDVIFGLV